MLGVARIAAIQAAKRTAELIPLCHPLPITRVAVEFALDDAQVAVRCIEVTVETVGRTGVEMEALTAVSVGLLTIYDMCKAVDRGMRIEARAPAREDRAASRAITVAEGLTSARFVPDLGRGAMMDATELRDAGRAHLGDSCAGSVRLRALDHAPGSHYGIAVAGGAARSAPPKEESSAVAGRRAAAALPADRRSDRCTDRRAANSRPDRGCRPSASWRALLGV